MGWKDGGKPVAGLSLSLYARKPDGMTYYPMDRYLSGLLWRVGPLDMTKPTVGPLVGGAEAGKKGDQ